MIDQELLHLLGISNVTPERAAYITKRVYSDNEILLVAEKLSRDAFVVAAVHSLDPARLARLVKRVQPEQAQPELPAGFVSWSTGGGTYTGRPQIQGHCSRCGQDARFDGEPDAAATIVWAHCVLGPSTPPAHVVEKYRNGHGKASAL